MGNFFVIEELTKTQEKILETLWKLKRATGMKIWKRIVQSDTIAYSTVMLNLQLLCARSVIRKKKKGREVYYMFNSGTLKAIQKEIERLEEE